MVSPWIPTLVSANPILRIKLLNIYASCIKKLQARVLKTIQKAKETP
jgi:hypothetical protein